MPGSNLFPDADNKPVSRAMILAAGLGTRLKPFTDKHPKALAPVNGKSLLQRNIEYLQRHGIYDVVINTHHFADQIAEVVAAYEGWGSHITISYEKDVLETGGGLKFAATYLQKEENFVLINADVLTNLPLDNMITQHLQNESLATLAVSNRSTSRYLLFTNDNELCGWQNVQSGEVRIAKESAWYHEKAFSGVHVISHRIFQLMNSFSGKFSMIDVYLKLAAAQYIKGFAHDGYLFADVGKPESIVVAESLFL